MTEDPLVHFISFIDDSYSHTMNYFLVVILLLIANRKVLGVQPGDPFPKNNYRLKWLLDKSDNDDPDDDVPLNSKYESQAFIENRTLVVRQPILMPMITTPFPTVTTTSISRNNLIKINRWKYEDMTTNQIRYWYEPEGAHVGKGWAFDRVAFLAYARHEPGTKPVFAFHSESDGEWTNTVQLDPTPPMRAPGQWIADGVSFYTYPTKRNSAELQPVWRYWSILTDDTGITRKKPVTLLVINTNQFDQERIGWIRDQILFYALPFEA